MAPTADSLCVKIMKEDSSVPPKLICPHWGSASSHGHIAADSEGKNTFYQLKGRNLPEGAKFPEEMLYFSELNGYFEHA